MTRTIGAIAIVLLIGANALSDPMPSASVQTPRLNSGIGPAVPQRYKSVRDAKHWKNPYLVVRREGIEVAAKGLASGRKTVAVADLEHTLIELPLAAWPYGRVAAVQEIGIRAADGRNEELIADNLDAALAVLEHLEVTAHRWPS